MIENLTLFSVGFRTPSTPFPPQNNVSKTPDLGPKMVQCFGNT